MASYDLIAHVSTVQVLSPTVVNQVVYATIQTQPSGVICTIPVPQAEFDDGTEGPLLTSFANDVESLMNYQHVIAGQGTQRSDANGLTKDYVTFVVEYVSSSKIASSVTAEADVPVNLLSEGGDPQIESVLLAEARAIIDKVYANLVSAASG